MHLDYHQFWIVLVYACGTRKSQGSLPTSSLTEAHGFNFVTVQILFYHLLYLVDLATPGYLPTV